MNQRKSWPHLGKGFVVIMNNAPWHKGNDIKMRIEKTGAKLIKFPLCSPGLNPVEHAWANLKERVKTNAKKFKNVKNNIECQIQNMNQFNLAGL